MDSSEPICLVCNKPGRHFVPPSMGQFGYHRCSTEPAQGTRAGEPSRAA